MNWTSERPAKPGWFWYREEDSEPAMLNVLDQQNLGLCARFSDGITFKVSDLKGVWAGPLEPPT